MMTPERWQQVKGVLEKALELTPEQRPAFLDHACSTDHSLRREVELLIIENEQIATRFLSTAAISDEAHFQLSPGKRIGAYEILEEIAHGGMGVVYGAVRADGQYRQGVALKIVRTDLDAELTATRFRNERQILASLDHANIAKILDGGTTADGIPYFVMEFVDGLPITEYCDKRELSIDSRLQIFRTVCSAVHHAHQRLVIHRDLKPSNILITAEGIPKLLDFGIAKILDPSLVAENTTVTAGNLWLMTPEYASPEQVRNETITTATDVYSLGIILYQLLTGRHPYKTKSTTPHDIMRAICEQEPEKPSTAVLRSHAPGTAGHSATAIVPITNAFESQKLRRVLAGDLDNIVLKALRKEPARRYVSVEQFSEDLWRYLEDLPVLARKDTLSYRAEKFVSRNKIGVAAVAVIIFSLTAGLVTTLYQARIARQERTRAERRFNDVRSLANSLIFEVHDSIHALPGATATRKLVLQRAQEYLDRLTPDSQSDPALLAELAAAYTRLGSVLGDPLDANLGSTGQALQDYRRATELRKAVVAASPTPENRRELAESYMTLSLALTANRDTNARDDFLEAALSMLEPLAEANPGDVKIQFVLAKAFERTGQNFLHAANFQQARKAYEKSLEIYERLAQENPKEKKYPVEVSFAHKHLGGVLIRENELELALREYRVALSIDEAQIHEDPENANTRFAITYTYSDIGYILGKQGNIDAALVSYRKAFDIRNKLAAADLQDARVRNGLANTYNYIARLLWVKGDFADALEDERQALKIRQAIAEKDPTNGSKQLNIAFAEGSIGETYVKMAFQPHTSVQRQLALCQSAAFWLNKALPEFRHDRPLMDASDAEYPTLLQQALDRSNRVIFAKGKQHPHPGGPNPR